MFSQEYWIRSTPGQNPKETWPLEAKIKSKRVIDFAFDNESKSGYGSGQKYGDSLTSENGTYRGEASGETP